MSAAQVLPQPVPRLSIHIQTGHVELVRELAEDWRRLCLEDPAGEPFYRPEWTEAFLLAFAPAATLTVVSAWSGGRLRGVLPVIQERSLVCGFPARRIRFAANVHCCRAGLVSCPGREGQAVVCAMWQTLKTLGGWDLLDFDYVAEGNAIHQIAVLAENEGFRVARKGVWQSLSLTVTPGWQASLHSSFRSTLRQRRRKLEESGKVTLRYVRAADPQALEAFYKVESSGWKGRQGTAIDCDPRTRRFYDFVARAAAQGGHLALDFLELDGTPIAAHFALNCSGRYLLVKAAYDEACRRFGPGHLLVHEVLNQFAARDLRELDFVGPAAWDEARWAPSRRDHFRVFIFRKGAYGSWLHALRISARERMKHMLGHAEENSNLRSE